MHSNPKIYFTISPNQAGLTDQLLDFCTYYKLGLCLGYQYVPSPFNSPHSSFPPPPLSVSPPLVHDNFFNKIFGKIRRKFYRYWNRLELLWQPDIYDFLGFNAYLAENSEPIPSAEYLEKIEVILGDAVLEENGIKTFQEVQTFVRNSVSRKISGKKDIFVTFKATSYLILMGKLIHSNIPDLQDGLDLNKAYFKARQRHPWKSNFKDNKIKLVTHIRQGDVAVIETPWNTFIPVWEKELVEYNKFEDIQYDNRVLHIDEYYQFIEKLQTYFIDTQFSSLLFSDGFARAFSQLSLKGAKGLNLTKDNIKKLVKSSKSYNEKAFKKFEIQDGRTLMLGEHPKKLCNLIHSILIADICVIGPRAGMVPKLLATYGHVDSMPIVIVLHKGTTPPFSHSDFMGFHAKSTKFIYVNILADDYEFVFSKLSDLIPALQSNHKKYSREFSGGSKNQG